MPLSTREIVEGLVTEPAKRLEIWALALDRGLGSGMQIEKWLLVEMLAQLYALQRENIVSDIEGDHQYPLIKKNRFEHCDLWWKQKTQEHWLEVKTIVTREYQSRENLKEIIKDLDKPYRLRKKKDIFHHLAVIFPLNSRGVIEWRNTLDPMYAQAEMECTEQWLFPLWQGNQLAMILYSEV